MSLNEESQNSNSKIPIIENINDNEIEIFNDNEKKELNQNNNFDNMLEKFNFPSFNNSLNKFFDKDFKKNNFEEHITIHEIIPNTIFSSSFITQSKENENGEIEKELYKSQSIKHYSNDGHFIKEMQEAYKNFLSGIEKVSHLRILDEKGHKFIKERNRNTGEIKEKNIFKNLKEDELDKFNVFYNNYRNKIQFQKYYKFLKDDNFKNRFDLWNGYSMNKVSQNRIKCLIDELIGDSIKF